MPRIYSGLPNIQDIYSHIDKLKDCARRSDFKIIAIILNVVGAVHMYNIHYSLASPLWAGQYWWIYPEGQSGYSGKGMANIA